MKPFALVNLSKEHWNNPRRARKQLLYSALLKNPEVERMLYVDPHRKPWQSPVDASSSSPDIKIWQGTLIFPGERIPLIRSINRRLLSKSLVKRMKASSHWHIFFYHPWDVPLVTCLSTRGEIFFDWTEDWAVYHDIAAMKHAQRHAVKLASGVITVSEKLYKRAVNIRGADKHVLFLPNASAWQHAGGNLKIEKISSIPKPRVGYVGHVGGWLDLDLVTKLAKLRPNWHWIMVGHVSETARERLLGYSNIHLLGQVPYSNLPGYMARCQVLAALYQENFDGDATKLYDYLTIGSPIVSTDVETARRLIPHVRIANGVQSWIDLLEAALKENDLKLKRARQEESLNHTWDHRASVLLGWIKGFQKSRGVTD